MTEPCFYRVSVKGLEIDDQGRILLCIQNDGTLDLPGGGLEHGEEPHVGLAREILEETGLETSYVSLSPKYFVTAPRFPAPGSSFAANVIYEIKLKNYNFTPSEECQELRFMSLADMEGLDLLPNVRKLLVLLKQV